MRRLSAPAKLNLALVVGPLRDDGKHEVATIYQRLALSDRVALARAPRLTVTGFAEDTIVAAALRAFAERAGVEPRFRARIWKRIPVASGLGGGSSDAATALRLANETLDRALPLEELRAVAAALGADVPFFLEQGPQLGTGDGSELTPLELPQAYWIVVVLPRGARKSSTAAVYEAFDRRSGADGFAERRAALTEQAARIRRLTDLAELPPNDLGSSPVAARLRELGAFRADVAGAGPAVYGLFLHRAPALAAARALRRLGPSWVTVPAWYG